MAKKKWRRVSLADLARAEEPSDFYAEALIELADSYSAGEITPDEYHERLADLRQRKLERPNRPPESPTTGR